MNIFEALESEVRTYCRSFPTIFKSASGSTVVDQDGKEYLDFFCGAGALNYGHNHPQMKRRLIDYLEHDGILHSLDMATEAKAEFLQRFESIILRPRGLDYKIQFVGPTGTNAVEAALKLVRKVTGRKTVLYFYNAYHGLSLGSLAVTANPSKRAAAGVPFHYTLPVPFDGDLGPDHDTLQYLEKLLGQLSGAERPAAVILETIQAEGGVRVARTKWLQCLAPILRKHEVLLIVDDIQVGCGRTGTFFSFETADLRPDVVCLSKSIGGFGLPMALVLIRSDLDIWKPGEHNGTFRGNNLAFVAGAEALSYWEDDQLSCAVDEKGRLVQRRLKAMVERYPQAAGEVRGRGLIQGIAFGTEELAKRVSRAAFQRGLLIETAGPCDEVLKLLPALVIDQAELERGLDLIEESLSEAIGCTMPQPSFLVASDS